MDKILLIIILCFLAFGFWRNRVFLKNYWKDWKYQMKIAWNGGENNDELKDNMVHDTTKHKE